jgi:hypothetical protein
VVHYLRICLLKRKIRLAVYLLLSMFMNLVACQSVTPSFAQSLWYQPQDGKNFSGPTKFPADINYEVRQQMAVEREHAQFLKDPYKCFALMNLYKTYKPQPLSDAKRAQIRTFVSLLDLSGFAGKQYSDKDLMSMLDAVAAIKSSSNRDDLLLAECYTQLARLLLNLPIQNKHEPVNRIGMLYQASKGKQRAQFSAADEAYCLSQANILLDEALKILNTGNPKWLNQVAEIYELKALQESDSNEAYSVDSWRLAVKARLDASPRNDKALEIDVRRLLRACHVANQSNEITEVLTDLYEIFVAQEWQPNRKQFGTLFAPSDLEARILAESSLRGSSAYRMYLLLRAEVLARSIVNSPIWQTSVPRVTYGLFGTKPGIANTQATSYIKPLRIPAAPGLSAKVSKQTMDLYKSTFLVSDDVRHRESNGARVELVQELLDRQIAYRQEEQRKADRLNYLLGRLQKLLSSAPINK